MSADTLADLVGAYQTSGPDTANAPAAIYNALQLYAAAADKNQTSGGTIAASSSVAAWLLNFAELGGLQTSRSATASQSFAVAAHAAGQASG